MTAFRLKRKESERKGIRRVAHGRAEEAAEVQKQAFAYGQRLFAEKPKRFVRRLERYWNAAAL